MTTTRLCACRILLASAAFAIAATAFASNSNGGRSELGERLIAQGAAMRAGTIAAILDRWQPAAGGMGQNTALWRDMMGIQLSQMSAGGLAKLAALEPGDNTELLITRYREFIATLGADIGARFAARAGNTPVEKLGGTYDQLFTPITPCRLVDTRNAGGQIGSFATRNFFFYTQSGALGFDTQGGAAAPLSTSCPGTYNIFVTNGPPSAAVVTITIVNQGGPGNLIAWGGANPIPTSSALNYGTAANVGAIANTTVVPGGGRSGTGPGGSILDFAINVNAFSAADVVVDVVGYFAINRATPLDCALVNGTRFAIAASSSLSSNGAGGTAIPSCPAGYLTVSANARGATTDPGGTTNTGGYSIQAVHVSNGSNPFPWDGNQANCKYGNGNAFTIYGQCDALCCRIPGY